jgi:YHS domain-containing protein
MRTTILALVIGAVIVAVVILSKGHKLAAAPVAAATTVPASPATTQAANNSPPVNKYCAVEGSPNKVDPTVFVMYKGQKIGFCCDDCIKDFKKNPDKYVASMK